MAKPTFASIEIAATEAGHRLGEWIPVEVNGAPVGAYRSHCQVKGCKLSILGAANAKVAPFPTCPIKSMV